MNRPMYILFMMLCFSATTFAQQSNSTIYNPSLKKNSKLDTIHVHGFKPKDAMQVIEHPGTNPLLIDVRSAEEFATGHIKGAINVPVEQIESRIKELKKKYLERTILTIDEDGSNAMKASGILTANKFKWAYYLKGGLVAWRIERLALEK